MTTEISHIYIENFRILKKMEKKQKGKRKVSELQFTERWSDEETDKLLSYLEDNYENF